MSETNYSQVIGASSNEEAYMDPPSSLESIAAGHDAREGDSFRPSAPASSRDEAAVSVRGVGRAMRFFGQVLRNQDRNRVARYADGLATRIEHLATYVASPKTPAPAPKGRTMRGKLAHRARFVGMVASRLLERFRATALRSAKPPSAAGTRHRRSNGSPSS
jgi:hypothetical protein